MPPTTPGLNLPANNSTLDTAYANFDWSDVPTADRYVFELAGDQNFTNIIFFDSTLTNSNYQNTNPFANGSFYWRVTAFNQAGYSSRSTAWRFNINVILQAPVLIAPINNFVSTLPFINFNWNSLGQGVQYLFELSRNQQFTDMVIVDSALTTANFTNASPLANGVYFWRIKGTDGVRWSPYSDIWGFSVDAGGSYIPGDANNSGVVNGLDVIYLVNYLKGGGPAPSPYLAGDANGSCDVNGLDVVYLVNFFKGGPFPFGGDCKD